MLKSAFGIIENKIYADPTGISKNYYMGTMYRYERPGAGRYREFTQFGVEVLGRIIRCGPK